MVLLSLLLLQLQLVLRTFPNPTATPPPESVFKRPEACHSCVPASVRERLAIGFDLGQSYGTSTIVYDNATIRHVAKVPARGEYQRLVQRIIRLKRKKSCGALSCTTWNSLHHAYRLVCRAIGLPDEAHDVVILASLISALKTATEAVLEQPVTKASIAAPWQNAWLFQDYRTSDLNLALQQAGMDLGPGFWDNGPPYVGEASATLAAKGHWQCQPAYCGWGNWPGKKHPDQGEGVFLISLTNSSLYTAFTPASCNGQENYHGLFAISDISTQHGLDKNDLDGSGVFWGQVRRYLIERIEYFAQHWRDIGLPLTKTLNLVVVTGEGAERPELVEVVRDVVKDIPRLTPTPEHEIELLVPRHPAFAAAEGAAFWARLRLEADSYCDTRECCPFSQNAPQSDPGALGHEEL